MKNLGIFLLIVAAVVVVVVIARKGDKGVITDGEVRLESPEELNDGTYTVDPASSVVGWQATKPLASLEESGIIPVASGSVVIERGELTDVEIMFNTSKIMATDVPVGNADDLTNHLRSADFFAIETYPTASFDMTSIVKEEAVGAGKYTVTGDLTIKEETHSVTMPIDILEQNGLYIVRGVSAIDRTLWGLNYNSGSFFENLGDAVVSDEIELDIALVLTQGEA